MSGAPARHVKVLMEINWIRCEFHADFGRRRTTIDVAREERRSRQAERGSNTKRVDILMRTACLRVMESFVNAYAAVILMRMNVRIRVGRPAFCVTLIDFLLPQPDSMRHFKMTLFVTGFVWKKRPIESAVIRIHVLASSWFLYPMRLPAIVSWLTLCGSYAFSSTMANPLKTQTAQ